MPVLQGLLLEQVAQGVVDVGDVHGGAVIVGHLGGGEAVQGVVGVGAGHPLVALPVVPLPLPDHVALGVVLVLEFLGGLVPVVFIGVGVHGLEEVAYLHCS